MCDKGCGADYKKSAHLEHNCVAILRSRLDEAFGMINLMGSEITDLKLKVKHLEDLNRNQRRTSPTVRPEVIAEWANQLTLAQVTYWGGLISTPDAFLQTQVKDALEQSCAATSCPLELIEVLMQHSRTRDCFLLVFSWLFPDFSYMITLYLPIIHQFLSLILAKILFLPRFTFTPIKTRQSRVTDFL